MEEPAPRSRQTCGTAGSPRAHPQLVASERPLGAPRIHGKLLKLRIDVGQAAVSKYRVRRRKPPSQTWRTFLENHAKDIASIDFFTAPTARWTGQQIVEAFPWDAAPKYVLRNRDGAMFRERVRGLGIQELLTQPRSPWQSAFVERVIGSTRRECPDHAIVRGERHPHRLWLGHFEYHHNCRTHLGLAKDSAVPRELEPPESGAILATAMVGGLHHRYLRRAAGAC